MGNSKRITVLMSVYNGEKFLRPAIESILSQSYQHFDFVIYDDCSTDDTPNIIKSYNDSRIVYRHNGTNQGLTKNLADGVAGAQTEYIARMDADDIAYPNRLEEQITWMDANPDIAILGTPVNYFKTVPGDFGIAEQPQDDATIKATLLIGFTLMHPSIMIRKANFEKFGINYSPEYRCSQDHALYLDCIRKGLKFANMPKPLLHMRAHADSISKAKHGLQQECSQRARKKFLEETHISDSCSEEEIEAYNTFASGYFPETPEKIRVYEHFVEKIYQSSNLSRYFNREIVRTLMAQKLMDEAYQNARAKRLKSSAKEAYRSSLRKYASPWTLKRTLKFYVKLLLL